MVTYCVGNPNVKRKAFHRESDNVLVSIDNDEVIASFEAKKRRYYVVGDVPFADLTVSEYILYQRSLVSKIVLSPANIVVLLKKYGVKAKLNTPLSKLSRCDYRVITFIARVRETTETVYINFDSLEYNRKNRHNVGVFIKQLGKKYNVYVAVTDSRFIPRTASVLHYATDCVTTTNKFFSSRVEAKNIADRTVRQGGLMVDLPPIKCVVSSNATSLIG